MESRSPHFAQGANHSSSSSPPRRRLHNSRLRRRLVDQHLPHNSRVSGTLYTSFISAEISDFFTQRWLRYVNATRIVISQATFTLSTSNTSISIAVTAPTWGTWPGSLRRAFIATMFKVEAQRRTARWHIE